MKVFITSDIEGITTTTLWDEVDITNHADKTAFHAQQMTREVVAACMGAMDAGADQILVNDAHDWGTNLDATQLPECAELIRSWSGHPYDMADGCDPSFDAALFIGCHSAAGNDGNPLSHTMSRNPYYMKLNGRECSEFLLYSYACALEGVPTVLVTGDRRLCEDYADLHPLLHTVAVKEGKGGYTKSISPSLACKRIRQEATLALRQDLSRALVKLPEHYTFEICYKEHPMANKMSYYPGFEKIGSHTIRMETDSLFDILRACKFVL
ncbi:MAG: M55 family metallopeptidase [Oscillospiraceae bacterium]|nr:M55 family metallopeptidase [Oscillospiraceae bacterium]